MMNENKRVPLLRFKGFSDDWEQRKLEMLFNKIRNAFVGTATPYYVKHGHFYLESNNIKDGKINRSTEVFINDEFYEKQRDKLLHTGDLVMVQSGHVGHTAVIPEELDGIAAHALIMFSDYKLKSDSHFLNYQFQTRKSKKELDNITTGNTVKHILASEMKKFKVDLPNLEEQVKIGLFFKQLDNIITLHQQKYDQLIQLKKAYLDLIFPKNGETFPKIRFADFQDEWEQRKFTDIVIRVNKSTKSEQLPKVEFEDLVAGEGRLNKDVSNKFDSRKGIEFLPNDILFGKLRPYLKNWIMPSFMGVALGDFWVFRPKNSNPNFVYFLIQSEKYQKAANDTSGTKMPRSDWKKVSGTDFSIPRNLEEQKQVGDFFKLIDDIITLHQSKLDTLKQLKQAYLQKMFI